MRVRVQFQNPTRFLLDPTKPRGPKGPTHHHPYNDGEDRSRTKLRKPRRPRHTMSSSSSPSPFPLLNAVSPSPLHRPLLPPSSISHRNSYSNCSTCKPLIFHANQNRHRFVKVRSQLSGPFISPEDHWGTWTALFATGAFGLW